MQLHAQCSYLRTDTAGKIDPAVYTEQDRICPDFIQIVLKGKEQTLWIY